ncbi:MAG: 30S ribosomal protein S15 [Candidatus Pacebacteria bacterium]|jgi:small subunit ribosomal protein S15|nr:30S ribosomal protein S15 [Candidatus Paceibacterota bacterium]
MADLKEKIKEIIKKYGKNNSDTGSPEVQIAILTEEILNLAEHLRKHKQDKNSKRGLILKVAKRRKLLKYLKRISFERYKRLVKELNL